MRYTDERSLGFLPRACVPESDVPESDVPESNVADQAVPLEGNFLQFSWVELQASRSLRDGSWDLS